MPDRQPRKVWSAQTERRVTVAVLAFVGVVILVIALAYWRLRG